MKSLKVKEGVCTDFTKLTIRSDRIRLVPISENFASDIFREFDVDITKYMMPKPASDISETLQFISESILGMQQAASLVFAITSTLSSEFLGVCACYCNDSPDTPELGLWLKKSAHGKKIGRESITLLVGWLQFNLDYQYLIYPVALENIASRRIPESLGGLVIEERKVTAMSGDVLNEVVYQIKSGASLEEHA